MKGVLAILLMVAMAFAGCSGKSTTTSSSTSASSSRTGTGTSTATSSATGTATATSTPSSTTTSSPPTTSTSTSTSSGPPQNHAPNIGTFSASRPNATTLAFNFTFTAFDVDGDALTWTLDANGDGTADASGTHLPGNVAYTYVDAGRYNATLRVTDGHLTATRVLAVNATLAVANSALFTASGNTTVPANPSMLETGKGTSLGAAACAGFNAGRNGEDCVFFPVNVTIDGHSFTAVSSKGNADVDMYDTCPTNPPNPAGSPNAISGGLFTGPGNEHGTVPAGVGCVILWDGTAGKVGTMTFTVV